MKSESASAKFPRTKKALAAEIAAAPGADRKLTAAEKRKFESGVFVNGGGYQAVREALAEKRKPGQRGPQASPTKKLVSIRYSPEVIEFFRASGDGWQARMDDVLKQWIRKHKRSQVRSA